MASPLIYLVLCLSVSPYVSCNFVNTFAVKFDGERKELEEVAKTMGFRVDHHLEHTEVFLLSHPEVEHRSKRSAVSHVDRLNSHPKVLYAAQQEALEREKRYIRDVIYDKQLELPIRDIKDDSIYHRVPKSRLTGRSMNEMVFVDPKYDDQWYLHNDGQCGGLKGIDLNLGPAWEKGFTGAGVVVCVLDDGIDYTHYDLVENYDAHASHDLNDLNDAEHDPMPDTSDENNSHGTRCGGEIAAHADNDVCGVGVAYNAKIGGVRILDGTVTDALEAEALSFNPHYIQVFSASWGPTDNGTVMEGPGKLAASALRKGVEKGRNGKGTIYVWATGNGGMFGDCCGADGYVSSIETLSVGSVNDYGLVPYFMETCTSTLAVVPSGGEVERGEEAAAGITKIKVVTTDINDGCIENFMGTSSAAPLLTGCVALTLEANPSLTWRDVQHIVVHSSRIPSVDHSWIINGGGLHVSHKFGFGLVDCSRMVELAQSWINVPEQHKCVYKMKNVNREIISRGKITEEVEVDGCKSQNHKINHLEHVQVEIKLQHSRRGDVKITLVSPCNTWSEVLSPRRNDNKTEGIDFTFMTVHSWSENPEGIWYLIVEDSPDEESTAVNTGMLLEWTLILYGTAGPRINPMGKKGPGHAHFPNLVEVSGLMETEDKRTLETSIKPLSKSGVKKNLQQKNSNAQLIKDLISAFQSSPKSNFKRKPDDYDSASAKKWNLDLLSRLDSRQLNEEKKSLETKSKNKLEDDVIDALVDAVRKELKSEDDLKKKREEEEKRRNGEGKKREEEELYDLVRNLQNNLQSSKKQLKEQNPVSQEKREEDLLKQVLEEVRKEVKEDPQAIHKLQDEISSRQKILDKKLLQEVVKMLEDENRRDSKRKEDPASVAERADMLKSVEEEELSIRTLSDLLNYLKEKH